MLGISQVSQAIIDSPLYILYSGVAIYAIFHMRFIKLYDRDRKGSRLRKIYTGLPILYN